MTDQTSELSPLHLALWLDPRQLPQEAGFIYSLAVAAKAEGCRISLIAPANADLSFLPDLGAPILSLPNLSGPRWLNSIRRPSMTIINQLKKTHVDVVLQFAPRHSPNSLQLRLAQEFPVVRWIWDSSDLGPNAGQIIDAAQLIVTSQYAMDQCGSERSTVSLIRPGVLVHESLAPSHAAPDRPAFMVCLDVISEYQLFADLLDACRRLMDEKADFLLFLCDAGKDAHSTWKLSNDLGLLDRISFIPYRYDIDPLLTQADVYIQLTAASRYNYTTLRAMSRRIPVVANPGVNDEFCIDGQTCRVFNRGRPEMLSAALADMLAHPAAGREMAQRAATHLQRHYSMSDAVQRLIALCRQAAGIPLTLPLATTFPVPRGD